MSEPVPIYQIREWNQNFENNRSRTIDQCSFVCVPNKQHGMGFCRVMNEPDGAAIYGLWHCILGACSQQRLPRDGWLTSNGHPDGIPWTSVDLSMKFRRPVPEVTRALVVLSSAATGWIIKHIQVPSKCLPSDAVVTSNGSQTVDEGRKEGRKEYVHTHAHARTDETAELMTMLYSKMCVLINRSPKRALSYIEQNLLLGVAAREDAALEMMEIESYHARNPQAFPNSVKSLLERWDEVLDWANRPDRAQAVRPPPPGIQQQAIQREIDGHPANRESAHYRTDCTPEQKQELKNLREKFRTLNTQISNA